MNEVVIAVVVIGVALVAAFVATKLRRPIHPTIVVGDIGDRPGIVLFSSTDCTTCKETIARLKALVVPFREVTYELEPHRFEEWEIVAVPLTVFVDADSLPIAVLTGVPSKRTLAKAAALAGVVPGTS